MLLRGKRQVPFSLWGASFVRDRVVFFKLVHWTAESRSSVAHGPRNNMRSPFGTLNKNGYQTKETNRSALPSNLKGQAVSVAKSAPLLKVQLLAV